MIRFIDLGDQILEDTREFAFFDTISDTFEMFNREEAWSAWEDFETDYKADPETRRREFQNLKPLERYKSLFPKEWP